MDLVYTVYKHQSGGLWRPGSTGSGQNTRPQAALCTVSSQNVVAFTADLPPSPHGGADSRRNVLEERFEGKGVYCADLNNPWEYNLVCSTSSNVTSLAWDGRGSKLCIGDDQGNIWLKKMVNMNLGEWVEVYTTTLPSETIMKVEFVSSARVIKLNTERRDSKLYTEKFQCAPEKDGFLCNEVCLVLTRTSLLHAVSLWPSITTETICVGRHRTLLTSADIGISTGGDILLAVCGAETPVVVYRLEINQSSEDGLQVTVHNHSSFSITSVASPASTAAGSDKPAQQPSQAGAANASSNATASQQAKHDNGPECRVFGIKFVLTDNCDAILAGLDTLEGGKVKMFELCTTMQTCHKIFAQSIHSPKRKKVSTWRQTAEFSAGNGAKLSALTTPRISIVSGSKPSCYIVVAFSDGTIQCLIRDSLQQIASVELPRSGNQNYMADFPADASSAAGGVIVNGSAFGRIADMTFTATGTGLIVADTQGQLYLYRMSPIADPGGPYVPAYLVTLYEYCMMSGQDWWDLGLAAAQTHVQTVVDKLEETFNYQPLGVKNFCCSKFMSIKASLFRLMPHGEYRAGDTLSMQLLTSIHSHFASLLTAETSSGFLDKSPSEKFENIVRNVTSSLTLDNVVTNLISAGLSRELTNVGSEDVQALISLGNWVIVLALHILSAKPEFKTRRGPGFWILQDGGLEVIREIVIMLRLWAFPRPAVTSREKDMDLNGKVYSMVTKLREKPEDESLLDECLILPSLVIIPSLDTLVSPVGVLSKLHSGLSFPYPFHFGLEPNLPVSGQHVFLDGLNYTQDHASNQIYDCMGKRVLGKCLTIRSCNRCKSFTKMPASKEESCGYWEKRWNKNCHCGGSWSIVTQ